MFKLVAFLHFILRLKPKRLLQSIELYRFYQNCIEAKHLGGTPQAELIRKKFLKNTTPVSNNLGAGSKIKKQTIHTIAKHASQKKKHAELLNRIVHFLPTGHILELGTSLGISTQYLANFDNNERKVISIEGNPTIWAHAQSHLKELNNVISLQGTFEDLLPDALTQYQPSIIYIDGNHTYEATLEYFQEIESRTSGEQILIFDDIYWSKDMMRAWEKIKEEVENAYTINLFRMGIVWKNSARVKQHFSFWY